MDGHRRLSGLLSRHRRENLVLLPTLSRYLLLVGTHEFFLPIQITFKMAE